MQLFEQLAESSGEWPQKKVVRISLALKDWRKCAISEGTVELPQLVKAHQQMHHQQLEESMVEYASRHQGCEEKNNF